MEKARKRNKELRDQLEMLQKGCKFCQQEKTALLQQKAVLQQSAEPQEPLQPDLPQATQELYGSVLDSVGQFSLQELKVLELEEQLQLVKMKEERDEINHTLSQVSDNRSEAEDTALSVLDRWYREMEKITAEETSQKKSESNIKGFSLALDKLFFNVKLKGGMGEGRQLSFSTRHGGICIHICIKEPSQHTERSQDMSPDIMYLVQSDLYVADLPAEGNRYLKNRLSVADFVRDIVWKHIDEVCLALS
ncbi:Hypp2691 [Branchiostoma lanceolatum]|uniref:Hypp2691 protein n=1 Tax=Branchiostoma lanceolatum TaxID=7740 RepID=A0A8K0EU29_BRALA|nr:Hypp2691 [Branchiostoma lanceolatum]